MKTRKKVVLITLLIICIVFVVGILLFINEEKTITKYSGYCMDEVRSQLGEYVGGVSMIYEGKNDEYYLYNGRVNYEGKDYTYYCKVLSEDKVDVLLQEIIPDESAEVVAEEGEEIEMLPENTESAEVTDATEEVAETSVEGN